MPKSNPTADLATRLVQELTACRAEAGDRYPIRLDRLVERLNPPPEPAAVLGGQGEWVEGIQENAWSIHTGLAMLKD